MAKFPYVSNSTRMKDFLAKIRRIGVPAKVDRSYLASVGFGARKDAAILGVLKSLGFVDQAGVPTQRWQAYRDTTRAPIELATAIREAYSALFDTYPDPFRQDNDTLKAFLKVQTGFGERTLSYVVRTFKTLCGLADFGAPLPTMAPEQPTLATLATSPEEPQLPGSAQEETARKIAVEGPGMTINVNIQLTLPATEDEAIYDRLFASLRKHLLTW